MPRYSSIIEPTARTGLMPVVRRSIPIVLRGILVLVGILDLAGAILPAHAAGSSANREKSSSPISNPFTESVQLPGGGVAAWGDYDNDGRLDIVIAGRLNQATYITTIYRNLGNHTFANINAQLAPVWGGAAAWADFDNDGDLDLAVCGHQPDGPRCDVYRNCDGVFVNMEAQLCGVGFAALAACDFNHDGRIDLTTSGSNQTLLYANTGLGVGFRQESMLLMGTSFGSLAWADMDNNGDLDLLIGGEYETGWGPIPSTRMYKNSNGLLSEVSTGMLPLSHSAVAWADYDHDGDMDVAIAGSGDAGAVTIIYRNDGEGVFTNIGAPLLGLAHSSLAWGDYDNDGRLDLAVTGCFYDGADQCATRVYRNEGNDLFVDVGVNMIGVKYGSVAWGDYDNDGRLDLLVSGMNCQGECITRIYRNHTPVANTPPSPPGSVAAMLLGSEIMVTWEAGSDAQTPTAGLTYNLRVGSRPGADDIYPAMADPVTGWRRIAAIGGMQKRICRIEQILAPPYYISVQTVDSGLAGSSWSAEQMVVFAEILNKTRNTRHDTIQAAVDAAQSGDHIVLAPGVYRGEGNRDVCLGEDEDVPFDLTISSTVPEDPRIVSTTIIDCQGSIDSPHRAFQFRRGQSRNTVLDGLTIRNGYAPLQGQLMAGGGISCIDTGVVITRCEIVNCHSDGQGGAIAMIGTQSSSRASVIRNCRLTDNSASLQGGAIYTSRIHCQVENCLIAGNAALNGGAIYAVSVENVISAQLLNCVLDANYATQYGGAMHAQNFVNCSLTNATITHNSAATGGGIYAQFSGVTLANSILWGNYDNGGVGEDAQLRVVNGNIICTHSSVQGWTGSMGGYATAADPLFVDFDGPDRDPTTWHDNNARLSRLSPCVNGGYNLLYFGGPVDVDGSPRIQNCRIDMGAYESPWSRPWADWNGDCHVDTSDANHLQACSTGAFGGPLTSDCVDADLDLDGDVDGEDFAILQRCWSGPYQTANADCM